MEVPVLVVLAAVVVAVAYVLGRFMKVVDRTPRVIDAKPHMATPAEPKPARSAAPRHLTPSPENDQRQLEAVTNWLLTQAFEQTGIRVADEPLAYQRIAEAAQKAMRDLKTQDSVSISLPYLTADASGPKHFETRLTREVVSELARY
jgi:hypothetical protein